MKKVNALFRQNDSIRNPAAAYAARAGRPPLTESPLISRQVSLTAEQWAKALSIGGSYSAGVRVAIEEVRNTNK